MARPMARILGPKASRRPDALVDCVAGGTGAVLVEVGTERFVVGRGRMVCGLPVVVGTVVLGFALVVPFVFFVEVLTFVVFPSLQLQEELDFGAVVLVELEDTVRVPVDELVERDVLVLVEVKVPVTVRVPREVFDPP